MLWFFVCVELFCLCCGFLFALYFFICVVLFCLLCSVALFCLRCTFLFVLYFFVCVVLFCLRCCPSGPPYGMDNIKPIYHRETSRKLYSRLKQHARGLRNKTEDNPLYKHQQVFHEGIESKFNYTPHKFFKDPLTRQKDKGTLINMSLATNDRLMNTRSEFRQSAAPRVQFVRGIQD